MFPPFKGLRLPQANMCFNKSHETATYYTTRQPSMAGTQTSVLLNWNDGHAFDTVDGDDFYT